MSPPGGRRVLVLGLDGADFGVIDPLIAAGELPNLAAWRSAGVSKPLASTVPAMSFPAWSTFLTGLEPGGHGLFDFSERIPGTYRLRFVNATHRRGASLLLRASQVGRRVLALGIPATFPPDPVDGLVVAGFDAPVSSGTDARSASDPALYRSVAARAGDWKRPDLDESASDPAFHERAALTLCARVESKTRFALEALTQLGTAGRMPELAVIVFAESDTVAHHFWRDHDPASPRHDPAASAARRNAVSEVYRRLDAACGALRAAFGDDALCVVISDHGSGGASHRVVHLNRHLADRGLLRRSPGGGRLEAAALAARGLVLRALPPAWVEATFRRARGAAARVESAIRFAGFDWERTQAFSEEANTQPGVWINLRSREPRGCVAPDDYEAARDRVIDALLDWKLPDGNPVVARARRREEVYRGPCVERAPDVVIELGLDAGYGLCLVPTPWSDPGRRAIHQLRGVELAGGRGRGTNGTHRSAGIWIASGPGAERLDLAATPALADLAPTLLRHLGVDWDEDLDGVSLLRADYGPEDEARVATRLRNLGYLE
jgi:predicted AlkP superfamily phosphohydrolase/phosphomutase